MIGIALRELHLVVERVNQVGEGSVGHLIAQGIAPLDAALTEHIAFLAQILEDIRDEWATDAESAGDLAGAAPLVLVMEIAQNE